MESITKSCGHFCVWTGIITSKHFNSGSKVASASLSRSSSVSVSLSFHFYAASVKGMLTLGAHAQRELRYLVCVCSSVCPSLICRLRGGKNTIPTATMRHNLKNENGDFAKTTAFLGSRILRDPAHQLVVSMRVYLALRVTAWLHPLGPTSPPPLLPFGQAWDAGSTRAASGPTSRPFNFSSGFSSSFFSSSPFEQVWKRGCAAAWFHARS